MIHFTYPFIRRCVTGAVSISALCVSTAASAQREAPAPAREDSRSYPVEFEPHFAFGAVNVYGSTGFGAGMRLSIPLLYDLLGRIPDNLGITFGGDLLHYDNCYFGTHCGANYLMLPVAAQWNLFVARRVSAFGELGAFVYKGFFNGCAFGDGPGCSTPSDFGVLPTLAVGARVLVANNTALTARVGYPTITFGVSFL